ncbi:thermonuclease family protein [Kaistella faecalis]|uniref:thermonuclease family protein n=1 Tax=Kaistella faecalis TaxID=2852098 RepID=UPI001C469AA2|nr:thermonuclease family protein [Chryseobacterium faecale]UFK97567.1 thermonuclease family protein [Chryseobacterium faecale]
MNVSKTINPSAKYFQIPGIITETHWIVERVLDGDTLIVKEEFGQESKEIRLYGLDAPEVHMSRKMREDEAKSHLPAALLLELGLQSLDYVLQVCPPGTRITLLTEKKNELDFWLRQLAYVIMPSGKCLNELLIEKGWAKTSNNYYCSYLHYFQQLTILAKASNAGIFKFSGSF